MSERLTLPAVDLCDSLATGIAVVDGASWAVLHANPTFARWFPAMSDADTLVTRLPGLDTDLATRRLAERGCHSLEIEHRVGARIVTLAIGLRTVRDVVVVEARDDSKRRQAECMLDSYARLSERTQRALEQEKSRVERLLLNVMPRAVLQEMRDFGTVSPQRFEAATVLMLDFVDFSEMAIARDPAALVAELNDVFSAFDRLAEMFGCERIKTNGDSYMAVSGMPEPAADHAANVASTALRMRGYLERRNRNSANQWRCRIGIASGPLVGSIVGVNKYVYDIFGPAVNLAARLEKVSGAMQITVCDRTAALLAREFVCEPREVCELKGFGALQVHELMEPGGPDPVDAGTLSA